MKQKVTVVGKFSTRRDADLAVEHLVQEHGVGRGDIDVHAAGTHNTAGSRPVGTDGAAKLDGPVEVSVGCPDENAEKVRSVLKEAGMQ
jgi:hypothetical protein